MIDDVLGVGRARLGSAKRPLVHPDGGESAVGTKLSVGRAPRPAGGPTARLRRPWTHSATCVGSAPAADHLRRGLERRAGGRVGVAEIPGVGGQRDIAVGGGIADGATPATPNIRQTISPTAGAASST